MTFVFDYLVMGAIYVVGTACLSPDFERSVGRINQTAPGPYRTWRWAGFYAAFLITGVLFWPIGAVAHIVIAILRSRNKSS